MRLSTEPGVEPDGARAAETIATALEAGITVFDTAHAYGAELGDNERLLAGALGGSGSGSRGGGGAARPRIVTKGGMTRPAGGWVPDGRAKRILADCEASLVALGGLGIDMYLIHAPDPRTPSRTTVRALGRLLDEGLVSRVGLSNVSRHQLDEALELVPVAAVEVALSVYEDRALRGGIVERCEERGIALLAHSPLGGPRRAGRLARRVALAEAAAACGATPAEAALAWLLALSPAIVPIPGARRPDTVRSAARAAALARDPAIAAMLTSALDPGRPPRGASTQAPPGSEVVVIMGIPGAGKTRLADDYLARGYARLNRDERGGALRELAVALGHELESDVRRVVLDNTYLTRAARSYVIETAARHGVPARCVWLETPLAQAQVNMVERLLDLGAGTLPTPEKLRSLARREPGALAPTQQMRALRELEPPSLDEGFSAVEVMPFARTPTTGRARPGVLVAASALTAEGWSDALAAAADPGWPHLVFDWRPDASPGALEPLAERLRAAVSGPVEVALCPHGAGPPRCWCRPPLPGLPLAFARAHELDPACCVLVGTSAAHRTLATALGAGYVPVSA